MNNYAESAMLAEYRNKLGNLLEDHHLVHKFTMEEYPVKLVITQNLDPSEQMEIYDTTPGDVSDRDSRLAFIFQDGKLIVRSDSRLIIPDELLGKIKGLAKKMHYAYLQAFYRSVVTAGYTPNADDAGEEYEEEDEE